MKTIFSTDDVRPHDRFAYWHEVACAQVVEHESLPDDPSCFEARIQAASIADIDVALIDTSPMTFAHKQHHAWREDSGKIFVCRQMKGRMLVEQEGRTATLLPGQIALLDPRKPFAGHYLDRSLIQVSKLPRSGLEARLGSLQSASSRILNTLAPDDFVSAFVAMLPRYAGRLDPGIEAIVQEQVVELLAASLAKAMDKPGRNGSGSIAMTRLRVKAAIDSMLADPELSVRDVAARAGVSVRYANEALSGEGTSIMRLVLARRLDRCRLALDDAAQARRSISAIAYGWGFSDMTHFSRTFFQAFGVLPRDYRQMARMSRRAKA